MDKKEIKKTLEILKSLPADRKFFLKVGTIMVEITKEEAEKILKDRLGGHGGISQQK